VDCITNTGGGRHGADRTNKWKAQVYGDHVSRPLFTAPCLQGQQARSRSEIHHSLAWSKPRLSQDTVANLTEGPTSSPELNFRSAAVPSADEPIRPAVQLRICAVRGSRGHRLGSWLHSSNRPLAVHPYLLVRITRYQPRPKAVGGMPRFGGHARHIHPTCHASVTHSAVILTGLETSRGT
jgi:hypothetical protein